MRKIVTLFLILLIPTSISANPIAKKTTFQDAIQSYKEQNIDETFNILLTLAKEGNTKSQLILSNFYKLGVGTTTNESKGWHWINQAAKNDTALGYYASALLHLTEEDGTPRNFEKAAQLLRKSADKGLEDAEYFLHTLYTADIINASTITQPFSWFLQKSDEENTNAILSVFNTYISKKHNEYDLTKAKKLLQTHSKSTSINVLMLIANIAIQMGEDSIALKSHLKLAELGYSPAQYKVAKYYYNNQKKEEALAWYKKAAIGGSAPAQRQLIGILEPFSKKDLISKRFSKDNLKWLKEAAKQESFLINEATFFGIFSQDFDAFILPDNYTKEHKEAVQESRLILGLLNIGEGNNSEARK